MLGFLLFTLIAVLLFGTGGLLVMLPILALAGLIWLVTLPLQLAVWALGGLFRIVFGVVGALLGILIAPVVMVVIGIALVGAFLAALLALLAPLVPVVLLLLLGWGVYRLARPKTAAASQYYMR